MIDVDQARLSVVSVSAMVHKFKDTKLSSVALKSDKVMVMVMDIILMINDYNNGVCAATPVTMKVAHEGLIIGQDTTLPLFLVMPNSRSIVDCRACALQVEVNRGGVAGAGEAGFDPDAIGERFRYTSILHQEQLSV